MGECLWYKFELEEVLDRLFPSPSLEMVGLNMTSGRLDRGRH